MSCKAIQFNDQMNCSVCDLVWDVNDPDPPSCKPASCNNKHVSPPPMTLADLAELPPDHDDE